MIELPFCAAFLYWPHRSVSFPLFGSNNKPGSSGYSLLHSKRFGRNQCAYLPLLNRIPSKYRYLMHMGSTYNQSLKLYFATFQKLVSNFLNTIPCHIFLSVGPVRTGWMQREDVCRRFEFLALPRRANAINTAAAMRQLNFKNARKGANWDENRSKLASWPSSVQETHNDYDLRRTSHCHKERKADAQTKSKDVRRSQANTRQETQSIKWREWKGVFNACFPE
jgi:hypothetical protein